MESISTKSWIKVSLLNLLLVSSIGVLMRYKIGFEFPYFDQKYLQHAHSHFAFVGWVTHTLMVLITLFLKPGLDTKRIKSYNVLVVLNLLCAYGMLISFTLQGYGAFSIVFSTLSIFVSFAFALFCFKDFRKTQNHHPGILWFKASLLFNILSSLGTFALAYMMATKNISQHGYLASVYWYLHFQYNGWFLFACIGLFIAYVKNSIPPFKISNSIFWLFALSCIPAYGLSVLWLKIPVWIFVIIASGAVAQSLGWIKWVAELKSISFLKNMQINMLSKFLFITVALAFTLKLVLQLGSTIPAISDLAFGFRPIVIAYLHLVLLAIISVFLITYLYANNLMVQNKGSATGLVIFFTGVFFNELALAVQGIASFSYHIVPYINEFLFFIAIVLFLGLMILFLSQFLKPVSK